MKYSVSFEQNKSSHIFLLIITLVSLVVYTISYNQLITKQIKIIERPNLTNLAVKIAPIKFLESELVGTNSSVMPPKAVFMTSPRYSFGLGNQLFYYAQSYALSRNLRIPLVIAIPSNSKNDTGNSKSFTDREFGLNHFSLPKGMFLNRKEIDKAKQVYVAKCQMARDRSLIPQDALKNARYYTIRMVCFLESVFKQYERELQQIQVKLIDPSSSYKRWKDLITSTEWPIAVHVRRGDLGQRYWSAPFEYFRSALRRMKEEAPGDLKKRVFVFSDDIESVMQNLLSEGFFPSELGMNMYFVSGSYGGLTNLEELDLMIRCKSIVISNSTFSWWAAYLMKDSGEHKKIVIRPQFNVTKHWNDNVNSRKLTDYALTYPTEWIKIDT